MMGSAIRVLRSTPPYPILFTLAWMFSVFGASGEPLSYFWRPLILGLGIVVVSQVVIGLVSRRVQSATLVFSIAWFLFLLAWWIVLPLIGMLAWRLFVDWERRRAGHAPIREGLPTAVTRLANYFSALLLGVATVGMVLTFPFDGSSTPELGQVHAHGPDIYLLMLDGYPRPDTLAELGIDDEPFVAHLASLGFEVSSGSRSNYNTTMLSLPALFDGAYVAADDGLRPPLADREAWELRRRSAELQRGRMLTALRQHGYAIATVPNLYGATALLSADQVLYHPYLNLLEHRFIYQTLLEAVIDAMEPNWIRDQWAESVDNVFRQARAFPARSGDRPALLFAHVVSPHPPILFTADGSRPDTSACHVHTCGFGSKLTQMGLTLDEFAPLLAGQIAYLNDQTLAAVDSIVAQDPDATILVFSDHGARFEGEISDEYFHSLFAARVPGHPGIYPDAMSLTNALPILLNSYFGESYPVLPYRAWESDDNTLTGLRERSVSP